MRLLVIDTALEACSVGLAVDDSAPVMASEIVGRGHAERLMPMIREVMDAAGLAFADLDRIAVTVGPGSFTGLRIGIAAARGVCLVTGAEAVGIGTLAAHADAARAELGPTPVLAVLAAVRGEVYGQHFSPDGTADGAPRLGAPQTFVSLLAANTMIAGSGADALADVVGREAEARIVHRASAPDVAALLRLARLAPSASERPRPLYLRPPDAKPQASAVARR